MFEFPKHYDVIVVGGGHAGIEAALAAARMGCSTLLLTINLDTIGQMSCNPAIGGTAKGQLVREIDALGGEMGINTDMTAFQFRMLNTKKGPAVWSPRAQCDKKAYQFRMKWVCEKQENLDVKQARVEALVVNDGVVQGVDTDLGVRFRGKTVILTTGTFLCGLMHIGRVKIQGGRLGDQAAYKLSESLRSIGLELGRLKTGTPPRLNRRSIDFSKVQMQPGDDPPPYFTHWKEELFHVKQFWRKPGFPYPPGSILERAGGQIPCYITHTTEATAKIIREHLHESPLYAGEIKGIGPRYCPSIEDKIVRFPEKPTHQLFLEPEGINTEEFYLNGFSTSLPFPVQLQMIRTVVGCENAEIIRPAYAVEYDFCNPIQITHWLETKICKNLFLAGQINGTSGYEEAAAQGIMAGINAALRVKGHPPLVLGRDQAYIGVLIDDLVTKGVTEPYRIFTSRAEFRLLLRQDNADLRLSEIGYRVGLLPKHRYNRVVEKKRLIDEELQRLKKTRVGNETLEKLLMRPEITYKDLPDRRDDLPDEVIYEVEVMVKYAGFIERQLVEVQRLKSLESKEIPENFDFNAVLGLRTEARIKLSQVRPRTIGQAARIPGVSPADISVLSIWLARTYGSNDSLVPPPDQENKE